MRPNQLRAILIFLITPNTTWIFAGYPYTTGTQKASKISNKNSPFNWVHSLHTELMNASHSTNLFTNSCDHISTNGKAPLHSHLHSHQKAFDMGEAQQALAVKNNKKQRFIVYWQSYLELLNSQLSRITGSQFLRSSGSIERHVFASLCVFSAIY